MRWMKLLALLGAAALALSPTAQAPAGLRAVEETPVSSGGVGWSAASLWARGDADASTFASGHPVAAAPPSLDQPWEPEAGHCPPHSALPHPPPHPTSPHLDDDDLLDR